MSGKKSNRIIDSSDEADIAPAEPALVENNQQNNIQEEKPFAKILPSASSSPSDIEGKGGEGSEFDSSSEESSSASSSGDELYLDEEDVAPAARRSRRIATKKKANQRSITKR